jgi:hypothetical protein
VAPVSQVRSSRDALGCVNRTRRDWSSLGGNETASSAVARPWRWRSRLGTTGLARFANERGKECGD